MSPAALSGTILPLYIYLFAVLFPASWSMYKHSEEAQDPVIISIELTTAGN